MSKHASKLKKKVDSYNIVKHHLESRSSDLPLTLTTHSIDLLIHIYQYFDSVLSHLPNKWKYTIVALLVENPHIQSIRRNMNVDEDVEELKSDDEDTQEDEMVDVHPIDEEI